MAIILVLLIQIIDDLEDILALTWVRSPWTEEGSGSFITCCICAIRLFEDCKNSSELSCRQPDLIRHLPLEAISLINQTGAATYVLFELNRISHEAHKIIQRAALPGPSRDQLDELVSSLVKFQTYKLISIKLTRFGTNQGMWT